MVGQHNQLKGQKPGQTLGYSEGQGGLACYNSRGFRVRHDLETQQQQQHTYQNGWS